MRKSSARSDFNAKLNYKLKYNKAGARAVERGRGERAG